MHTVNVLNLIAICAFIMISTAAADPVRRQEPTCCGNGERCSANKPCEGCKFPTRFLSNTCRYHLVNRFVKGIGVQSLFLKLV